MCVFFFLLWQFHSFVIVVGSARKLVAESIESFFTRVELRWWAQCNLKSISNNFTATISIRLNVNRDVFASKLQWNREELQHQPVVTAMAMTTASTATHPTHNNNTNNGKNNNRNRNVLVNYSNWISIVVGKCASPCSVGEMNYFKWLERKIQLK